LQVCNITLFFSFQQAQSFGALFRYLMTNFLTASEEEPVDQIDLSCFSGNLRRDDRDNTRDCWRISDGNNFRVRSKHFCFDKSKVLSYSRHISLRVCLILR